MTTTNHGAKLAVIRRQSKPKVTNLPPFPSTLPPSMRKDWAAIIEVLSRAKAWTDERAPILEAYLLNIAIMRQATEQMMQDGGPVGPDGRPHAASAIITRHAVTAGKLASSLGITGKTINVQNEKQPDLDKPTLWKA